MQGPIENALMLVAAGNAQLAGRDITGFWPDAPTFKFLKRCEFRLPPASGNDKDDFPLVAADPMDWFDLQQANCGGYRLHAALSASAAPTSRPTRPTACSPPSSAAARVS